MTVFAFSQSPVVIGMSCLEEKDADSIERDLTFIGLVGLLDPPRPEAKRAVATV